MKPSPDLPHLHIVPTSSLHPHELPDQQRAVPLAKAIQLDRVLRNPPIVLPIEAQPGEFVVLDGANRVTALSLLQVPYTLVQVAHPNWDSLEVKTWNHILLDEQPAAIEALFQSLNGFVFTPTESAKADQALAAGESLLIVRLPDGVTLVSHAQDPSLEARIGALREMVSVYDGRVHFERTSGDQLEGLAQVYRSLAGLVVFPEFAADEVVLGAASGWHFPPGITRFIVSPRALRLNYPLEMLSGSDDLETTQAHLDDWIRERMRNRRVRYYAESTFLFDE